MLHITELHLTMLNQRSKAGRKPAVASEHLLVGMKIAIPVLPSIGSYISDVNDGCFNLPAFANRKFQLEKGLTLEILQLPVLKGLHYIKN